MRVRLVIKIGAIIMVIGGIGAMLLDTSPASHLPLLIGLFMLLVTANPVEDERSIQVKNSSLYIAFVLSYGFKLVTTNLSGHQLISFALVEIDHFLIFVLALANIIFYARLYVVRLK